MSILFHACCFWFACFVSCILYHALLGQDFLRINNVGFQFGEEPLQFTGNTVYYLCTVFTWPLLPVMAFAALPPSAIHRVCMFRWQLASHLPSTSFFSLPSQLWYASVLTVHLSTKTICITTGHWGSLVCIHCCRIHIIHRVVCSIEICDMLVHSNVLYALPSHTRSW